jgi:hypothetical protein
MKQLTRYDFNIYYLDDDPLKKYFSYKEPGIEICLEPCLNGFDVALYDDKQNLLLPKQCTNINPESIKDVGSLLEFYEKTLIIASKMLHGYKTKKGKEELKVLHGH